MWVSSGVSARRCSAKQRVVRRPRRCTDYIQRNEHRMHHPEFHARGLCTSSGVVETGCKLTVGT
jgi:hypothetical protein